MAHLRRDRDKLLARVKKIRGQLNAVEASIADDDDCSKVLMTLAACRGALNALPDSKRARATAELIDVLRAYLR